MTRAAPGSLQYVRSLLPQGLPLPDGLWHARHRFLVLVAATHAFALPFYGIAQGVQPTAAIGSGALVGLLALAARSHLLPRRGQATAATLALLASSSVAVQFAHGSTAAHAHGLLVLALVALYHDWRPLIVAVLWLALAAPLLAMLGPSWGLAHADPAQRALAETVVVVAEAVVLLAFWSGSEHLRARSDLLLESAGEGVVGLDSSGRVTFANPAARDLLGPGDVEGAPIAELMRGTGMSPRAATGVPQRGMLGRPGQPGRPVEWTLTPTLRAGVGVGSVMVLRDVTVRHGLEQRLAAREAELRQHRNQLEEQVARRTAELTEANRELEAFSYTVSHDLRSPLRALGGFARILRRRHAGDLPEDSRNLLRHIDEGAVRMGELIESVLVLTRIGRVPFDEQAIDVSALARHVVDELAVKSPERRVHVDIEPGLRARGDPGLVRLALANLLHNAWKFSARVPEARIALRRTGDGFVVEDNGAGFDMALSGGLFQPFHRLHEQGEFEGTGIGLATVARVVQRHGGHISAEAAPGRGARFTFTLGPGTRRMASPVVPPAPAAEPLAASRRAEPASADAVTTVGAGGDVVLVARRPASPESLAALDGLRTRP